MLFKIAKKLSISQPTGNCIRCQVRRLVAETRQWIKSSNSDFAMADVLKQIERRWKPVIDRHWEKALAEDDTRKDKRFILSMFPYPSGSLHLGHIRVYSTSDVLTRFSRLRGHPVVHPIGFDSFGLPAENAAFKNSIDPAEWTKKNIDQMTEQLTSAGFAFNWRQNTSDPEFYKWTQWLFIKLFKAGLVYRGMGLVIWDPVDQTVLADEQVDEQGRSWRSGAIVEKRCHRQWFVKTNSLASYLYDGSDIDFNAAGHWKNIILHQRHWIGKPEGYLFYFKLENEENDILPIFTTHPEILLNPQAFFVITDKHWLYKTGRIPERIRNPFTGETARLRVLSLPNAPPSTEATIMVRSESFENAEQRKTVLEEVKKLGIGGYWTSSKYRDWLVSRQRYWGTPIPIIYCANCGVNSVPEDKLPVKLPAITDWRSLADFKSDGVSNPIQKLAPEDWIKTECPCCGNEAIRETETLDTFFDSSWYFLRYSGMQSNNLPYDQVSARPTWCYVGGKEHSALHLFYARFVTHFLHQQGLCQFKEPFQSLLMQAIVKGKTYKINGRYVNEETAANDPNAEVEFEKMSKSKGNGVNPDALIERFGCDATRWWCLADKNPESEIKWQGEDKEYAPVLTFFRRVWITLEDFLEVRHQKATGQFGKYLAVTFTKQSDDKLAEAVKELDWARNEAIYDMTYNLEFTFQTRDATVGIYKLLGILRRYARTETNLHQEYERALATLLILVQVMAPHFAAECWSFFSTAAKPNEEYDINRSIFDQKWPQIDSSYPIMLLLRHQNENLRKLYVNKSQFNRWSPEEVARVSELSPEIIESVEMKSGVFILVNLKQAVEFHHDRHKKHGS